MSDFLNLLKLYWRGKVGIIAQHTLLKRSIAAVRKELPSADDVRLLAQSLKQRISDFDVSVNDEALDLGARYAEACALLQSRLLSFNKRRVSEIEEVT